MEARTAVRESAARNPYQHYATQGGPPLAAAAALRTQPQSPEQAPPPMPTTPLRTARPPAAAASSFEPPQPRPEKFSVRAYVQGQQAQAQALEQQVHASIADTALMAYDNYDEAQEAVSANFVTSMARASAAAALYHTKALREGTARSGPVPVHGAFPAESSSASYLRGAPDLGPAQRERGRAGGAETELASATTWVPFSGDPSPPRRLPHQQQPPLPPPQQPYSLAFPPPAFALGYLPQPLVPSVSGRGPPLFPSSFVIPPPTAPVPAPPHSQQRPSAAAASSAASPAASFASSAAVAVAVAPPLRGFASNPAGGGGGPLPPPSPLVQLLPQARVQAPTSSHAQLLAQQQAAAAALAQPSTLRHAQAQAQAELSATLPHLQPQPPRTRPAPGLGQVQTHVQPQLQLQPQASAQSLPRPTPRADATPGKATPAAAVAGAGMEAAAVRDWERSPRPTGTAFVNAGAGAGAGLGEPRQPRDRVPSQLPPRDRGLGVSSGDVSGGLIGGDEDSGEEYVGDMEDRGLRRSSETQSLGQAAAPPLRLRQTQAQVLAQALARSQAQAHAHAAPLFSKSSPSPAPAPAPMPASFSVTVHLPAHAHTLPSPLGREQLPRAARVARLASPPASAPTSLLPQPHSPAQGHSHHGHVPGHSSAAPLAATSPPALHGHGHGFIGPSSALSSLSPSPPSASLPVPAPAAPPRGLVGLANLGNTCFLNSALQCLANVPPLADYFASGARWRADTNPRSPSKGEAAVAFGELMARMWAPAAASAASASALSAATLAHVERPERVKRAVALSSPRFAGYEQHDAQEFLRALLDALHDDTNRVRTRLAYEELKDPPEASDAEVSAAWWRYFAQRNDSEVWRLFAGQLRAETVCAVCRHRSRAFDPFMDLSLPIPQAQGQGRDGAVSLAQCLQSFTQAESIAGGEWHCSRCRRAQPAEKRLGLFRLSPVLVLHLKRFGSSGSGSGFGLGLGLGGGHRAKILCPVTFPAGEASLDMAPFLSPESPELRGAGGGAGGGGVARPRPCLYDLVGVVNHMGSLGGGHYTADCRNRDDGLWRSYNDSHVRLGAGARGLSAASAYLLFYLRRA